MINITLLTSEDDITLTKTIAEYFTNYPDVEIVSIISNKIENSEIILNFRRYIGLKKLHNTTQYKEIDKILTETNTHYIITSGYNEKIPPNFCKKYNWKIINLKKYDMGIEVFFEKEKINEKDIFFRKDIFINRNETINETEIQNRVDDMAINFYPTLIEKVIRETYKKLYNK